MNIRCRRVHPCFRIAGFVFSVFCILSLFCTLPVAPDDDPYYARVTIDLPNSPGGAGFKTGDTISLTLSFRNCRFISGLQVKAGNFLDTTIQADYCNPLLIPVVIRSAGEITVTATIKRTNNTTFEETASFTASAVAPTIKATSTTSYLLQEGQSCTLWVSAQGIGPLSYAWSHNGTILTGAVKDTLILTSINSSQTGIYRCIVSNPWESVNSPELKVDLIDANAPPAPANLTRIKVEDGIMLVWDAVEGADRYLVYRDTIAQSQVPMFAQTTNTFLIVPNPGTLYYWVRASREGILSPPSRVIFTGVSKPVWSVDSISADLSEGDSVRIPLRRSVSYSDNLSNLRFSLVDQSAKGAIREDSLFSFRAGHLDSGVYHGNIIVTDGTNPDTCPFIVRVSARYHTVTIQPVANGTIALAPSGPQYRWGDSVSVSAVAANGFEFFRWTGDITALGATARILITQDRTIGAEFVPVRECVELTPGTNLNAAVLEASRSSNRLEKLCPQPGKYNGNGLLIGGKVVLVIQK